MASLDPFNTRIQGKDQSRMPQYVPTAPTAAPLTSEAQYRATAQSLGITGQALDDLMSVYQEAQTTAPPAGAPIQSRQVQTERIQVPMNAEPYSPALGYAPTEPPPVYEPTSPAPAAGTMQAPMPNMRPQQADGDPMSLAKQPGLMQSLQGVMQNPLARGGLGLLLGGPMGALGGAGSALLGNVINGRGLFGGEGGGKSMFRDNANAHLPSSTGPKTFVQAPMPKSNPSNPSFQYNPNTGGYGYY